MNSDKQYITQMPKNYTEFIIALNVITFLNSKQEKVLIFNQELNHKQKLLSTKREEQNLFDKYNIGKNDFITQFYTGDNKIGDPKFIKMELFDLFTSIIIKKQIKLGLKEVFNVDFASKQLLTRQYIRKKIKNKMLVLFHINKESIKNIVYYLLSIQGLYKLDQVDEDTTNYTINDEYKIALFCNSESNENSNIMLCQQVYHQITLVMPEIKNMICIGNILFQDHIENNKYNKENGVTILYNLASYICIIEESQILLCISLFSISNTSVFFPTKLISPQLKQAIASNFKIVDIKKIKSQEEINGRFIPI